MTHRLIILTATLLVAALATSAQVPTAIASLFDGPYRNNPAATETIITGDALKSLRLSLFHSLSIEGKPEMATAIEKAVKADAATTEWIQTVTRGGKLQSAVYELASGDKKRHRYVLFLNSFPAGGNEAIVIYLEGKATPEQIKQIIKQMTSDKTK